ncbi:MAG: helix-turn-helix transcriptional regulator [Ruminococcus sp.]
MLERTGLVFSDIMKDYEIRCRALYQAPGKLYHFESAEAGVGGLRQCELRAVPETEGRHGKPSGAMIKEYIGEHYSENITLNDIADIVFLNPLSKRHVQKETGQTLTQYLIDVRIDKAKEMLRNPERTIGEIACMVGYQDERHFSKLFPR